MHFAAAIAAEPYNFHFRGLFGEVLGKAKQRLGQAAFDELGLPDPASVFKTAGDLALQVRAPTWGGDAAMLIVQKVTAGR